MYVLRDLRGYGFEEQYLPQLWRWICAAAGAAFQGLEKRQLFGERPCQQNAEAQAGGFGGLCEVGSAD